MVPRPARSVSPAVRALLDGPPRVGRAMGRGHVLVDEYVVALVPLGAPLMPNGIESDLRPEPGERVPVGAGRIGHATVSASTLVWDPVPRPRVVLLTQVDTALELEGLAGRGPGLTPAGDDTLAGYLAGLVLFHGRSAEAHELATRVASRTTALSATLIRHAARGELPEPAHALLERGDVGPLLRWGRSSGRCLALGLAIAFGDPRAERARSPSRQRREVRPGERVIA
jgi:hypothetical protein